MLDQPIPHLSILNPHPLRLEGPGLLHELVWTPQNTTKCAIDFLEYGSRRTVSYEALHVSSDTLAKKIMRSMARLENAPSIVPVILPQCPELYVTLLAILKAGKAFCPINLDTPDERLEFILEDLSAQLVITSSSQGSKLSKLHGIQVLLVEEEEEENRDLGSSAIGAHNVDTDDLAYVLYTSGSTGVPKAVTISHRAVTQSMLAHDRHIPPFSRFLQFAAPTFDVALFEIFFTLFRGGTLVGANREHLLADLPSFITESQVDAAELTPTVVDNLLNGRASVPTLSLLLTIGEMLTQRVVNEFGGSDSKSSILWGMYGPTEAAIHCTLQPDFRCDSQVGNIGLPLDTVSAFVVEPSSESKPATQMTLLPVGDVGELVVGGPQVADGYLNRPELTADAFIEHPQFGLLYRTGDKARLLRNGNLECLGRIQSGQVKIRGQRVELGEIEQVIYRIDGCRSVATVVAQDNLVAFCVAISDHLTEKIIVQACRRWLPTYMVPTEVVLLSSMPQLPSGKIDKKTLENRYLEQRNTQSRVQRVLITAAASNVHRAVAAILGRGVSTDVSLASYGLDSLQAIRLSSSLRREGYQLGAADILAANNLDGVISLCEQKKVSEKPFASTVFDAFKEEILLYPELRHHGHDIVDVIPCTPFQEAMLAATTVKPSAYCNWIETELSKPSSFVEIRECLECLADANEILRSGYLVASNKKVGSFAQIIWKHLDVCQIVEVTSFSRGYTLGTTKSMLRPITIQVNATLKRPRVLFQLHHAVYDGWSFDIILRDLNRLFRRLSLKPRPQYREVVQYYSQLRDGKGYDQHLLYWKSLLADFSPTRLPNFNGKIIPPVVLQSVSAASSVHAQSLYDRSREMLLGPQVLFQAATVYLVGAFLASTDITIGTVTSGRIIPVAGIETIVGPCILTLPLRLNLEKCSTIQDMLQRIHKGNQDLLQHCSVPLMEIARVCGVKPGERLSDVLFVWQQSLIDNDDETSAIRPLQAADDLEFILTLEFEPRRDGIASKATYDPSIVPEAQARQILRQIDDLVKHFLHDVTASIDSIGDCFSPQNLSVANPSPVLTKFTCGPAHAVERWAHDSPDKEALILNILSNDTMVPQESLTYAALNSRANQVAHSLLELGVRDDQLVCVLMEKSTNLYVSILAVLKLGCGYLPILPETPSERTCRILRDAQVQVCVSSSYCSNHIREEGLCTVVDLDCSDLSSFSDQDLDIGYDGSHLAYAVFTSGSTGTPKGVLVTQDNLMSNLDFLNSIYPSSSHSRLLQACSQAFDVSVFEIFYAWYAGMSLCTATTDDLFQNLEDAVNCMGITHLSLTPTVAALINPAHVPKVEFLVTAGEALTEQVRRQWVGRGLHQGYGPSETTNICTIRSPVANNDLINNIGSPFSNTSAFVLEPGSQKILPRGAVGELCFGGSQVFRGYLNSPELNAQKLINLPGHGQIYRSGDMGMLLCDNSIMFTGRSDDQVKLRGQRVELGEITSIVLDNHHVKDCVTLLFNMGNFSQRLVTFWVPVGMLSKEERVLSAAIIVPPITEICASLLERLPAYMVPTHLVPISRIPQTAQYKTDKRLLFSMYSKLSPTFLDQISCIAATEDGPGELSSQEKVIGTVLADFTKTPLSDIRKAMSFFNLGIDSISAIHLSTKLREAGIANASTSTILRNPSIGRLAANCVLESAPKTARDTNVFSASLVSQIHSQFSDRNMRVQKILPCTPLQAAMLSTTTTSVNTYCNSMIFSIAGDLSRMQKCWLQMFKRHDILRTAFVPTAETSFAFAQVVLDFNAPQWAELSPDDEIDVGALQVSNLIESFAPPIYLATQKAGTSSNVIFCCHHALYDGIAISNLLHEIQNAYHNETLPSVVPFERYLGFMLSQDIHASDNYWRRSLTGIKPTHFPTLSSKIQASSTASSMFTHTLGRSLRQAIEAARLLSVSLLPVVQAAWAKLLHFYILEDDICFGNVVSGRTLPDHELERLIAPCFNTLPVRLAFDSRKTNADLVRELHDINVSSLPFQLTPLRRIRTQILREKNQLFNSLVILQQPSAALDESIWSLQEDIGTMDLPVVCELVQDTRTDRLILNLHFRTDIMSESDAKFVAETFDGAFSSILQYPNASAGDTVGFPSELLGESNVGSTASTSLERPLLHSAFERHAIEDPASTALEFEHSDGLLTAWSYKELNEIANQIAHALIRLDIGLEDVVPVHIAKSPYFYASILGVLKAGAAFAPIHPDLPAARKQLMMADLRPKVLTCTHNPSGDWYGGVPILDVRTVSDSPRNSPDAKGLSSTNLAYCLYTSGSTGVPKAVAMDHRAPLQTIASSKSLVPWKSTSKLLQYAAISFDMCYYDCFLAWSFGITLCAAEQDDMLDNLARVIISLNVDLLDLTPSVAASLKRVDVPCVQWMYCIGEPMSADVIQEWEGACVNSYGPTEAAFCTTMFPVRRDTKANVIGRPFPSTSFAVFSLYGERAVPLFGIGELYIGGTQLARGYHHNPELSEQRFVQRNGERFYRTGDVVRMLSDGNFEFIGRVDDQVKIRGLRVELGEISHVIHACHPDISAVTVQIFKKDMGAKDQLVAFLATTQNVDQARQLEVRKSAATAARAKLPVYMVPKFYICVQSIPKSTAGKVEKKALLDIFRASNDVNEDESNTHEGKSHLWTVTECHIREIFGELSQTSLDDISPFTTIFQLGLDSISAVQVAAALRKRGLNINAVHVLKYSSCIELGAHIDRSQDTPDAASSEFDHEAFDERHRIAILRQYDIEHAAVEALRPCTPLQQGMISQLVSKEGDIYLNHMQYRLSETVDLQRLKESWLIAMKKHRMLRTGFTHIQDGNTSFAMIHYMSTTLDLPWDDAADLPLSQPPGVWIEETKRKIRMALHDPPWRIRIEYDGRHANLDLLMFHALFDAQSLRTIFNDVFAVYHQSVGPRLAPLDPVISTILSLSSSKRARSFEFWRSLVTNSSPSRFPNLAPLQYDPEAPAILSKTSTATLSELEAGCKSSNVTLQAAGLASWLSILSIYTGETSVTCGLVLSGRNFEAAQSAVFPCITTVPFTLSVDDEKTKVLQDIMALTANILQYQFTPLKEIQKLTGYPNEPLFDTIFAFQKMSQEAETQDLWTLVREEATIEYPVSIELEPRGGHLEYRLTYLPHLIPKGQAVLILDQLDQLMTHFVLPEHQSLIAAAENQLLFSISPPKEETLPAETLLVHELMELSALRFPRRIALEFATSISHTTYASDSWTYAELDAEGNRVANLLLSYNALPGDIVGICFDKCPQASFASLGILKAGCSFVALDPAAPAARRAFIVEDSGAKIVLSMKAHSENMSQSLGARILNLDEVDLGAIATDKPELTRAISSQDCSYCLYTSGTTGTPKGCEITHENTVQALLAFQRIFTGRWKDNSRWLQFASFHFDVSVLEQYWSWSIGICVVSAPRDLIFEDIARTIRVLSITHLDLTPSLARILHPEDVPSLWEGVFITGGESLKQEILDVWGPKRAIYNFYGPTEATIGCTVYPRVPANGKPSNIGYQFDNVGTLVLKPNTDCPVLRGGAGELCVFGKLVGKGYLNRPELTKERFSYFARFGVRVYRTGDLVRVLHDGSYDFLGRSDDQVKLRGQRLETGEINSVIKRSDRSISDVVTLVLKHPKQQKEQLVSFVVALSRVNGGPKIVLRPMNDLEKARRACQDHLPGYMIPTHFVALSSMPLSANNKADGKALRQMYEELSIDELQLLSTMSNEKQEKWSRADLKIRDVLVEVLRTNAQEIGKFSSLFELGLDSISLIDFSRALKQAGLPAATPSIVMRNASIGGLSEAISQGHFASKDRGLVIAAQQAIAATAHRHKRQIAERLFIDSRGIEDLAPCTPLQEGMIARSLDNEEGLYFNTFHIQLAETVDTEKLQGAWEAAYSSIPILRTVFVSTEDGFMQVVLKRPPFPWKTCSVANDDTVEDRLRALKPEWLQSNRRLLRQPLEIHLISKSNSKLLVLHIFHALYDGISIGLIFKAVWDLYSDRRDKDTGPLFQSLLPHGPLKTVEGAQEFWQSHVLESRPQHLPVLYPGRMRPVTTIREIVLGAEYESLRRKLSVTHQAIAQACWATVLKQYTRGVTTLGVVTSGRSIDVEGADGAIGPMFNTLPYVHRLQAQESWATIVQRTHEFNVAAHPYQHTPLRDIMKWTKRSPAQPLFDNLFVYQITEDEQEWQKNEVWEIMDGEVEADYPLAIEVKQRGDRGLEATLVAQGRMLDGKEADQLLGEFEQGLRDALRDPNQTFAVSYPDNATKDDDRTQEHERSGPPMTDENTGFAWSDNARSLKQHIADISGVAETDISATTSVFELGLDSIDAIKLSSKLKKAGIDLPVSGIVRGLTIANMVHNIVGIDRKPHQKPSDMIFKSHKLRLESHIRQRGIDTSAIETILPLTPLQEAMVAEMIASDYRRYYNHDILRLSPDTDLVRLQDAWKKVVRLSPILRTSFIEIDDPTVDSPFAQIVHRSPHDFISFVTSTTEPDFVDIVEELRRERANQTRPGPPFSVRVLQSPEERYLVISIAHGLYDGSSLGLLHSDVHDAYFGRHSPRPNYETSLQEIITATGADATAFWRDYLSGSRFTPFKLPNTDLSSGPPHREEIASRVEVEELTVFAKRNNVTLQAIGQTAYSLVQAAFAQSLDVCFGSVLSGRDDERKSQILFPTMNTVAIRTILHGSLRDLLRYVQDNFSNIQQWQHFPLRRAKKLSGVEGTLFDSLFIYQKGMASVDTKEERLYESVHGQSDVEYPVCVEMEVVGEQLMWRCAIKEELFDLLGGKKLLQTLDTVLERIVREPDTASIEFTASGTSICGLPAFNNDKDLAAEDTLSETGSQHEEVSTNSSTVKSIREILAFVSKTSEEEMTPKTTIFHIGLDSISAIKVSSLLRKRSIVLSVGEIIRAGTVEKMAQIADERTPSKGHEEDTDVDKQLDAALSRIDRVTALRQTNVEGLQVDQLLPATAGQIYMLSMWLQSKGLMFFSKFAYRIDGNIAFDQLKEAWKGLVASSSVLRSCFIACTNPSLPYLQAVLRETQPSISNVSDWDEPKIEQALDAVASRQPYVHLFARKTHTGWDLKLKLHHALYDGVSLPLMMQQLQDLCNSGQAVSTSSEVFRKLCATTSTLSAIESRRSFWTNYLRGAQQSALPQPSSPPRFKVEIFKPGLLPDMQLLEARTRREGITAHALFLAVFSKLYAALTTTPSDQDVMIGLYLANRSHPIPGISDAAVPTVNLVPLRVPAPMENEVLEVAAQIQYAIQEISSSVNSTVSLVEIYESTGVKVDCWVNFLKLPDSSEDEYTMGHENDRGVRIRQVDQWEGDVSRVSTVEDRKFEVPAEMRNECVSGAYLHSIDVEATVRNGALDVGVFAPETMLGLEDAERLVNDIKLGFERVMGMGF
ncbi:hypothetical protein K491DRAFT_593966 [Lophiostoma macrostomum CBS 122681]|uniref:Carrier domain-containing protein n=1 Tax=Lophiostoma macrostomum CBS 122681 TaxID=1314788 RepID=A0A6A6TDW0_9PLEO|nr:hypothetical protein K491DRAFT_593966 [Lophiostoma macrostomum CBS 122681]